MRKRTELTEKEKKQVLPFRLVVMGGEEKEEKIHTFLLEIEEGEKEGEGERGSSSYSPLFLGEKVPSSGPYIVRSNTACIGGEGEMVSTLPGKEKRDEEK